MAGLGGTAEMLLAGERVEIDQLADDHAAVLPQPRRERFFGEYFLGMSISVAARLGIGVGGNRLLDLGDQPCRLFAADGDDDQQSAWRRLFRGRGSDGAEEQPGKAEEKQ